MSDNWLDDLEELYEADKSKQLDLQSSGMSSLRSPTAADIFRSLNVVKLLERVQSILLRGGGSIDVYDHHKYYDRIVTLVWQGPISAARLPDPTDPTDFYYIAVGVKEQKVFVNDKHLANPTPQTLRQALVAAARQPGRKQNKR